MTGSPAPAFQDTHAPEVCNITVPIRYRELLLQNRSRNRCVVTAHCFLPTQSDPGKLFSKDMLVNMAALSSLGDQFDSSITPKSREDQRVLICL